MWLPTDCRYANAASTKLYRSECCPVPTVLQFAKCVNKKVMIIDDDDEYVALAQQGMAYATVWPNHSESNLL